MNEAEAQTGRKTASLRGLEADAGEWRTVPEGLASKLPRHRAPSPQRAVASRAGTQEQAGENQGRGQSQVLQLQCPEQTGPRVLALECEAESDQAPRPGWLGVAATAPAARGQLCPRLVLANTVAASLRWLFNFSL